MSEVIKISLTFAVILFFLRKKVNIGFVMLIASGILFVLYHMRPGDIFITVKNTVASKITITLLIALSLIRMFELILREQHVLSAMMTSVKNKFSSRRAVIVSMPLLIGMLPSLGGAYFSAPMVKEASAGLNMSREEKAFVNYWFRHPWEYMLPLYPGILLASAVAGIPLYDLIMANMVYALMIIVTGFAFSMRNLGSKKHSSKEYELAVRSHGWKKETVSFLPIAVVLLLVAVFRVELHYALFVCTIPLLFLYRYPVSDIFRIVKHGFAREVVVLIFGVMLFKETMEASGAVKNLSDLLVGQGIPAFPILCLLPFITGLLTGLTVGFVGSTFPLLTSLGSGGSLAHISLAFAAGFLGVLLSPVHLCLVLTKEYFKADLWGVYRRIIPSSIIIFLAAVIEYMILQQ